MAYSMNDIISPKIPADRVRPLASYNTGPCAAKFPVSRFFSTSPAMKNLGIYWANTGSYSSFSWSKALYGG